MAGNERQREGDERGSYRECWSAWRNVVLWAISRKPDSDSLMWYEAGKRKQIWIDGTGMIIWLQRKGNFLSFMSEESFKQSGKWEWHKRWANKSQERLPMSFLNWQPRGIMASAWVKKGLSIIYASGVTSLNTFSPFCYFKWLWSTMQQ